MSKQAAELKRRNGYFYLNVGVGAELKEALVRRAQEESLSLGNLVLRELAREFKVKDPVYGQNRVPKAAAGDQLFLLVPPMLDWRMAAEANRTRSTKSAIARRVLTASLNGGA